jgi:serine phosphatase RsbU (regulator of sigma subunit)
LSESESEIIDQQISELYLHSNFEFVSSLKYAAILQRGIFPKQRHFDRVFEESFVLYLPQQIISGDFYWLSQVNDHLTYLAVGDCTGHGVPGAMLSILANNLLSYSILNKRIKKTSKILQELDKRFIESFSSDLQEEGFNNDWFDISLVCINSKNKTIQYSGAKRKGLLVQKEGSKILKGSNYPIGGWQMAEKRHFDSITISYEPGDALYLSSDGYQDQIGGHKDKKYKSYRLKDTLITNSKSSMEKQKNLLLNQHKDWKGANEQTDDICLVGVRLK